ncbi:MAG: flagellar assembly protein FliW [Magnetococcales bacterium]|nr:flagellar assembly protein FliW [Magnetococcales bacterium]
MEVQDTRFGTLKVNEEEIITLNGGLMGFPMSSRYIMFPYSEDSSFFWLQSIDEPEIAFIVINPFDFFNDLVFEVADSDAASIGLERGEDVEIFTLVTIPDGTPEEMRTNLAGPVVVNVNNRQGRQILVKEYSPRQALIPAEMKNTVLRHNGKGHSEKPQQVAV